MKAAATEFRLDVVRDGFVAVVSELGNAWRNNPALADRLRALHVDYPVLVFSDMQLQATEFREFAGLFGALEVDAHLPQFMEPGLPEIINVVNFDAAGAPDAAARERGAEWHSDSTYKQEPCAHTLLYALEIPDHGGGTLFADMVRAYATLPDALKQRIVGRRARHLFGAGPGRTGTIPLKNQQKNLLPEVCHPMVLRHPVSKEEGLYVNPLHTIAIDGLAKSESDDLLAALFAHATGPEFVYHHTWQVNEIILWDQRRTLHKAEAQYPMQARRRLLRAKICGALPSV